MVLDEPVENCRGTAAKFLFSCFHRKPGCGQVPAPLGLPATLYILRDLACRTLQVQSLGIRVPGPGERLKGLSPGAHRDPWRPALGIWSSMACGRMRISILRHCTRCTSFSFFLFSTCRRLLLLPPFVFPSFSLKLQVVQLSAGEFLLYYSIVSRSASTC